MYVFFLVLKGYQYYLVISVMTLRSDGKFYSSSLPDDMK